MSPTYSYRCGHCGWSIAINKSIAQRDEAPMCGDCCVQMTREVSQAVGSSFKGQGFYTTDSRR
jgi:predicted nucleic acid-binding Zn ribbon protein